MLHPWCSCFPGLCPPELALSPECPPGFSSRIWIPVRLALSPASCPVQITAFSSWKKKERKEKGRKGTLTDLLPTALSRLVLYSLVEAARQWRSSGSCFFKRRVYRHVFYRSTGFSLDRVWNSTQRNFFTGRRRSVFFKGCFLRFNLLRVVSGLLWMKYLLSWASLHEETHRGTRADFVLASTHLSYDYALPIFFLKPFIFLCASNCSLFFLCLWLTQHEDAAGAVYSVPAGCAGCVGHRGAKVEKLQRSSSRVQLQGLQRQRRPQQRSQRWVPEIFRAF